jgi:hypothetical protein
MGGIFMMTAIDTSTQPTWKQIFKDAVLELDPIQFKPKLEAAQKAIEDRLSRLCAEGADHRELMELEDARRTISFLVRQEQQM